MKVSIVIPIYKVEDYIERCLVSVFSQNYRDIEVILVDDASPDKSIEIASTVIEKFKKSPITPKLVTHTSNRGLSAARNSGIEVASGDYIYFLDSDDELYSDNAISILVDSAFETDADIVVGNHYVQYSTNPYVAKYSDAKFLKNDHLISSFVKGDIPVTAWNKLIRRDVFDSGIRFKEGILNEDELFSYQLLFANHTVSLTGKTTYRYNYREGSIMTSFNLRRLESPITVYEEASCIYKSLSGNNPLILQNLDHFAFKRYVDILRSAADIKTKRSLYHRLRFAQRRMRGVGKMRYIYNAHIYFPEFLGFKIMKIVGNHYVKSRDIK